MITNKLELGNKEISISVGSFAYINIHDNIDRKNNVSIGMTIKELRTLRKLIKKTLEEYEKLN